jgi:hypothetical protein
MVVRQGIMVEGIGGAKLLTSWQPESRETGRSQGQNIPFKNISTSSGLLPPIRPQLLLAYSATNSSTD